MRYTFLVALLFIGCPFFARSRDSSDQPSVWVTSIDARQGSLPDTVTAYGTVEPLPEDSTIVSQLRPGQVVKLYVSRGQKVKQGAPLLDFTFDPSALVAYTQAVAALAAAQKEQVRARRLLAQQLATQSQLSQADKAVTDAEAAVDAQKSQGGAQKTETITAPFDGVVTNISVSSGDRVQANAPLLQLAYSGGEAVALGVPLDDRANLQTGQNVRLEALDAEKAPIDGRVAFIANMLDTKTRLVRVLVTVPADVSASLVPGEQFRAAIETGKLSGVIVPRQAVLSDDKGPYIFQISRNTAVRVAVRIIGESGSSYVIDGPIDRQRKIVTIGNYELKDGALIREGAASTDTTTPDAQP